MNALNQDTHTQQTLTAVIQFNDDVNNHNIEAVSSLLTEDTVFENTRPSPAGTRYEGKEAVTEFWKQFFLSSPHAQFSTEELFASGDRCTVRWVYRWLKDGKEGFVRGVDVFRVRDGKIAEKLSYVKG